MIIVRHCGTCCSARGEHRRETSLRRRRPRVWSFGAVTSARRCPFSRPGVAATATAAPLTRRELTTTPAATAALARGNLTAASRAPAATRRCRRPRAPGQRVDQVRRPGIGDHHAGRGEDDENRRAPQTDGVVPVEVARLAAKTAAKPNHRSDVAPAPLPGHPQVEACHGQDEKGGIARAGDGARRGPSFSFHGKPPVPVGDRTVERAGPRRPGAEHASGVGIDEQRPLGAHGNGGGRARIRIQRHGRGRGVGNREPDLRQQRVDIEPRRSGAGGDTKRWSRSTSRSTDCWNVSSVPVTHMTRITEPATTPATRCTRRGPCGMS